ncbi:MAG: hypothetical protein R2769_14615 [Saprospiraceae bacterium]
MSIYRLLSDSGNLLCSANRFNWSRSGCCGGNGKLNSLSLQTGTFLWSTGRSSSINVSPFDTMTYSVTFTDANGCTASDTINVNVAPAIGSAGIIAICTCSMEHLEPKRRYFYLFTLNPTGGSGTTCYNGDVVSRDFLLDP